MFGRTVPHGPHWAGPPQGPSPALAGGPTIGQPSLRVYRIYRIYYVAFVCDDSYYITYGGVRVVQVVIRHPLRKARTPPPSATTRTTTRVLVHQAATIWTRIDFHRHTFHNQICGDTKAATRPWCFCRLL